VKSPSQSDVFTSLCEAREISDKASKNSKDTPITFMASYTCLVNGGLLLIQTTAHFESETWRVAHRLGMPGMIKEVKEYVP
jgi:hypothetical protein